MARKLFAICNLILCFSVLVACGGLRFSQMDPEAKDFHPRGIAIFQVDVGPYEEARQVTERIVAELLIEKKWFANVIDTETLNRQILSNEELRSAMTAYLSKLNTLNFSDPDFISAALSRIR